MAVLEIHDKAIEVPEGRATFSFYSKSTNLRLVRQPHVRNVTMLGTQQTVQNPVRYLFGPSGWLTVYEGQDPIADGPLDGETGLPGVQDALAWLRAHEMYNDLFHEDGNEPGRPLPIDKDFLASVAQFTAQGNVAGLQEMVRRERESFQRETLIDAATAALDALGEAVAAAPEVEPIEPFLSMEYPELVRRAVLAELSVPEHADSHALRVALTTLVQAGEIPLPETPGA